MSNDPSIYTSDIEQCQIDQAEAALNWIDSFPQRIDMWMVAGASNHGLEVRRKEAAEAMATITEALSDLFHKDRVRLQEITGYVPAPLSPNDAAEKIMKEISKGFEACLFHGGSHA